MPALVAPIAPQYALGSRARLSVTNTARARRRRRSSGSQVRISRQVADRFTATTSAQSSGRMCDTGVSRPSAPALCTRISSRPKRWNSVGPIASIWCAFAQIQRQQRRLAAHGADRVVGFLQAALGARGDHHAGAEARQFDRGRRADAAAGAGDQRDARRQAGRTSVVRRQQAELPVGVVLLIRQRDRIVAGEAGIAVMRRARIAPVLAQRAIQARRSR